MYRTHILHTVKQETKIKINLHSSFLSQPNSTTMPVRSERVIGWTTTTPPDKVLGHFQATTKLIFGIHLNFDPTKINMKKQEGLH